MNLTEITRGLSNDVNRLRFGPPVACVYNPLVYARRSLGLYIEKYGAAPKEVMLVGMNPGPFGMAQTGIPFGEVTLAREWLGVAAPVDKPRSEHPRRPIEGFGCKRREVSGQRLWGWARDTFKTPERFFERFFVANYCPLCFLEESGRNLTPDKLRADERGPLLEVCDLALKRTIECFKPRYVIGVGAFAEGRIRAAVADTEVRIGRILHPSPASPIANRGWAEQVEKSLVELGIMIGPSHRARRQPGAGLSLTAG